MICILALLLAAAAAKIVNAYEIKSWQTLKQMPEDRKDFGMVKTGDGNFMVLGGLRGNTHLGTFRMYNSKANTWGSSQSMLGNREDFGVAHVAEGKIVIAGGFDGSSYLRSVEMYDIKNAKWTRLSQMPDERTHLSMVNLEDGRLMVAGGESYRNRNFHRYQSVHMYDISKNSWSSVRDMPGARSSFGMVTIEGGRVVVIGGYNGSWLKSVLVYNVRANSWATLKDLPEARNNFGCANVGTEKIVIVGGQTFGDRYLKSARLYDIPTNTWSALSDLPETRSNFGTLMLGENMLIVVGGIGGGNSVKRAIPKFQDTTSSTVTTLTSTTGTTTSKTSTKSSTTITTETSTTTSQTTTSTLTTTTSTTASSTTTTATITTTITTTTTSLTTTTSSITTISTTTITTSETTTTTSVSTATTRTTIETKTTTTTTTMYLYDADAAAADSNSSIGAIIGGIMGSIVIFGAGIFISKCISGAGRSGDMPMPMPTNGRILSFTANELYSESKAAPRTQPTLLLDGLDGAYIEIETNWQAQESEHDGFLGMPAPTPPLVPYGTIGDDDSTEGEGNHSVELRTPRAINQAGAYLQDPDIEHANATMHRCKYRQPGEGGQRCKKTTTTKWCERHTCGIPACQNAKSSKDALCLPCLDRVEVGAGQSMYEEPCQRQSQVYDDGKVPGAADHFAGGAYASVGNDQRAYGSITVTSATYSDIDGTHEEVEGPYAEIDDDDISL